MPFSALTTIITLVASNYSALELQNIIMDVHVLVYDLSRGLARQMSMGILGFQLDAIYHTSIQLGGREYVYDGNIVSIVPGSSHLGRPEKEIHLGKTELPMDVIEEYLDSLRDIYTVEVGRLERFAALY